MSNVAGPSTLVELLEDRAARAPDGLLYTFLGNGEEPTDTLTFGALAARARAIAAGLREHVRPGERVVLIFPPGVDYVVGLWAVLYARAVAVPAYPPDPTRLARTLPRLEAIVADAAASAVLTVEAIAANASSIVGASSVLARCTWLSTDVLARAPLSSRGDDPRSDELAILQYTSGSTGAPKGVMLTHANVLANADLIARAFGTGPQHRSVIWLPPYHDMGLIGGLLQPVYAAFPAVLMSPMAFLEKPLRWLRAISQSGATISGGPNFAYDLCVRKSTPEERAALDLRSWQLAFSGAEPVRASTLERFADAFAVSGFRRGSFYPCYGLAEATLMVSGREEHREPQVRRFGRDGLAAGRGIAAGPAAVGEPAVELVSCGRVLPTFDLRIVDPQSHDPRPPGHVGEIWIAGPSVALGYWNQPQASEANFGARLASGAGSFLRTGDLGFVDGGELFVTGRAKDTIIVRGRNHFPDDLERTSECQHPALRAGCSAAFSVDDGREERVVIVQEIDLRKLGGGGERETRSGTLREIAADIRSAVAREHDIAPRDVVLISAGTIEKTSSGKIQRFAVKRAYIEGKLEVVARWSSAGDEAEARASSAPPGASDRASIVEGEGGDDRRESWLRRKLADLTGTTPEAIAPGVAMGALALESVDAVALRADLERELGVSVALEVLSGEATVRDVALGLVASGDAVGQADAAAPPLSASALQGRRPLGRAQSALWLLHERAPRSAAHNLARAFKMDGAFDEAAFRAAFGDVVSRHPILRARFGRDSGAPYQEIAVDGPGLALDVEAERGEEWPEEAVERYVAAATLEPLGVEHGRPVRLRLLRRRDHWLVVVAAHHLVVDLWSLIVIFKELWSRYEAGARGEALPLGALEVGAWTFPEWQARRLAGPAGRRLRDDWARRLVGAPSSPAFPPDRQRGGTSGSGRGGRHVVDLGAQRTTSIRRTARSRSVTPFTVMLAALARTASRYSGEQEVLVGCPSTGRSSSWQRDVVGYMSNVLPLRIDLSGEPDVGELLGRTKRVIGQALVHDELPFVDIVAAGRLARRRVATSPPISLLFSYHNVDLTGFDQLAALALGLEGCGVSSGGVTMTTAAVAVPSPEFGLSLAVAEVGGRFQAVLEYDSEVYSARMVASITATWLATIDAIADGSAEAAVPAAALTASDVLEVGAEVRGEEFGRDAQDAGDVVVSEAVRRHALAAPERVAVTAAAGDVSYGALEARVEAIARRLRDEAVGPESVVAVSVERTADLVAALLAVERCGAAYLPLEPRQPAARRDAILSDARPAVVLGTRAACETLERDGRQFVFLEDVVDVELDASAAPVPAPTHPPDRLAYVIYTSGSTGRPKGVEMSRRGLSNFLRSMLRTPGIGPEDRLLAVTTASFDIAALELYLPLLAGARVVIASEEVSKDGAALERALDQGITMMQATPMTWRLLLRTAWKATGPFVSLCGGEAMPVDLARGLLDRGVTLFNMYGPTETAVWSTIAAVGEAHGPIPIGRPIHKTNVHVLDPLLQPVPFGAVGELFIGGAGLARGYRGQPGETAERFLPHPGACGERIYRTGDRCRFREDGSLEYIERLDDQVKIRGFRVEPGEIEVALRAHRNVSDAVVVAMDVGTPGVRLVAFVVPHAPVGPDELKDALRNVLPGHMVPARIAMVPALPVTTSGKVDRKALAAFDPGPETPRERPAPRDDVERALRDAWVDAFQRADIAIDDDFFAIGGHSLLAMDVASQIKKRLSIDVPVGAILETGTIEALAKYIRASRIQAQDTSTAGATASEAAAVAPLSFAQQQLWLVSQLHEGAAYHMPAAFRISGPLDVAALRTAFDVLVERHESLRTTVSCAGDELRQLVHPAAPDVLVEEDLTAVPADRRLEAALSRAEAEALAPFDLSRGPMLRARLLRLEAEDHALAIVLHHFAADQASLLVLLRDLEALYRSAREGGPRPPRASTLRYLDVAVRQRSPERAAALAEQEAYWLDQLADCVPLALPADRVRPRKATLGGERLRSRLPSAASDALMRLGREQGATPFAVTLAAFTAFLARYCGQDDVCVGTAVSTRGDVRERDLVGPFINTVVIRSRLRPLMSFEELVSDVRGTIAAALSRRELPFEQLVGALRAARDVDGAPLVQATFAFDQGPALVPAFAGTSAEALRLGSSTAKFDLSVGASFSGEGVELTWDFRTELFDEDTVARMASSFGVFAGALASQPTAPLTHLSMLSEADERRASLEWCRHEEPFPREMTIDALVAANGRRAPDALAIEHGATRVSYGELDRHADALAAALRSRGVGVEDVVGLYLERSAALIVAMLAVLKAGGSYLALDPGLPGPRAASLCRAVRPKLVLTSGSEPAWAAEAGVTCVPLAAAAAVVASTLEVPARGASNVAYLIPTSGSTGEPKAVAITHRGVARLAFGTASLGRAGGRVAQVCATSFDAAPYEIWSALCRGAAVVIVDSDVLLSPQRFADELRDRRITSMILPAPIFSAVAREVPGAFAGVEDLFTGGDVMDPEAARRVMEVAPRRLFNAYGPAEVTTVSTTFRIDGPPREPVPIGRPVSNTEVYVLDEWLNLCPPGLAGEICIGGDGLARGYWQRPDLTAEVFVPHPFATSGGARLYRTGDIGRWRSDGALEFVGRRDGQIKIRGARVEPREVAAVLARDPAVLDVAVVGRNDPTRGKRLDAYVVLRVPLESVAPIAARAKEVLPSFMVPSSITAVPALPLSRNGKVDVRALPPPDEARGPLEGPSTTTENVVVSIVQEVLASTAVAVTDSFLDVGGHSLLAMQVASRLTRALDKEVPVRLVFEAPTLRVLAAIIDGLGVGTAPAGISRAPRRALRTARAREPKPSK